ncbi:hypothetical protein [Streptomyces sp. NPDC015125]|uniref:hypothetical protein n=1 Tax=Streptomyces sp. NPDC015125 TaxID=3364938 RepID=UPI0036F65E8F
MPLGLGVCTADGPGLGMSGRSAGGTLRMPGRTWITKTKAAATTATTAAATTGSAARRTRAR